MSMFRERNQGIEIIKNIDVNSNMGVHQNKDITSPIRRDYMTFILSIVHIAELISVSLIIFFIIQLLLIFSEHYDYTDSVLKTNVLALFLIDILIISMTLAISWRRTSLFFLLKWQGSKYSVKSTRENIIVEYTVKNQLKVKNIIPFNSIDSIYLLSKNKDELKKWRWIHFRYAIRPTGFSGVISHPLSSIEHMYVIKLKNHMKVYQFNIDQFFSNVPPRSKENKIYIALEGNIEHILQKYNRL